MSGKQGQDNTIRRLASVFRVLLCAKYGMTCSEFSEACSRDGIEVSPPHARRYLESMRRSGLVTRDDHEEVIRVTRHGSSHTERRPIARYVIHPDVVRKVWDSHRLVFDALTAEMMRKGAA